MPRVLRSQVPIQEAILGSPRGGPILRIQQHLHKLLGTALSVTALTVLSHFAFAGPAPTTPPQNNQARLEDEVRSLVTTEYYHGLPHSRAASLGPKALPILQSYLYNDAYHAHKPQICSVIGIIGAPAGFPILRDFIWGQSGKLDGSSCRAMLVAQNALGFIAKNSNAALEYLQQSTSLEYWKSLPWTCQDRGNLAGEMATMSINALALSERPEARSLLVRISEGSASEVFAKKAKQATVKFDEIKKLGFAEYKRRQWKRLDNGSK